MSYLGGKPIGRSSHKHAQFVQLYRSCETFCQTCFARAVIDFDVDNFDFVIISCSSNLCDILLFHLHLFMKFDLVSC